MLKFWQREPSVFYPLHLPPIPENESESSKWPTKIKKIKWWDLFPLLFLNFDISKAMNFICVLRTVNTLILNDVTVDIELSACGNSSPYCVKALINVNTSDTPCYIFVRGWSKPAPNYRNIRNKSIRCVLIFEAIHSAWKLWKWTTKENWWPRWQ